MGIEHFATFLIAGILLNLTPGQDTLYIIGQSISQGQKAGIMSALGIGTGSIFHTLAAALGLSAIITSSTLLFEIIKMAGALYLIFLGIKALLYKRDSLTFSGKNAKADLHSVYKRGILTNILNPKVAIFYLAFLPQFIDPNYSSVFIPFVLLGVTFTTTGTIWCLIVALFSSYFVTSLKKNPKAAVWLHRLSGTMFIGLGLNVALNRN